MNPNAKYAFDFFTKNGYSPEQAAGIVGNGVQESGLNTGAVAKADGRDGSDAVGIFQWNGSRAKALQQFAASQNSDPGNIDTQLQFALNELNTTEKSANARLKSATTVDQAAEAFTHFERPLGWNSKDGRGSHGFGNRLSHSLKAFSEFTGSSPTISYGDMSVPQITPTVSQAVQETERKQHAEATGPSLWQGVKDATSTEWIVSNLLGDTPLGRAATPDPSFNWTPESFKEATKGLPQEYWAPLADAHSQEHAEWMKGRFAEKAVAHKHLEDMGWTGTALQVGAALLDPAALAVAIATEGAATAVLLPAKASRIATILSRGAAGGIAGAAVVGTQDAADLERKHMSEYLMGAAMGMGISGTLGAMHRGLPPDTAGNIIAAGKRMEQDAASIYVPDSGAGSVGAKKAPTPDFFMTDDALESIHNGNIPETAFGKIRLDSSAQIDKSGIPVARALGNALLEDGVGKVGHSTTGIAAELEMKRFYQVDGAKIAAAEKGFFHDWADELKLGVVDKYKRTGEFFDTVGTYIRSPSDDAPAAVKKMAKVYQDFFRDRLEFQQKPMRDRGILDARPVAGADGIPTNESYLPRVADERKVRSLVERYTSERVSKVLEGAIRSAQPDLDDALISKMAKGWVQRRSNQAYGLVDDPKFVFMGRDEDALRAALAHEYGLGEADIATIISKLPKQEAKGVGVDPHLKRRIDMDEGFSMEIQPKFGGPAERVALSDLLVNDASKLADIYNRRTAGRIALARVRINDGEGNILVNGITKDSEFAHLVKGVNEQAAQMSHDGKPVNKKTAEAAVSNLQWAYDSILGRPQPSQIGAFADFSRYVRKYNFARLMNMMGFNQLQEMSNIVGHTSMKTMMQQMPVLGRIRDMDAGMIRKTALDRDLEAMGLATEELRNSRHSRWDEYGADSRTGQSQFAHNVENAMDATGKFTTTISGFKYVNEWSQMWAARAAAQSFADLAGNPTKANLKRMASLGLAPEQLEGVLKQIKEHSTVEKGPMFGGQLKALNQHLWTDLDARVAFENSLFRWSRRIIQENDFGSMAQWMSHPAAQILLQFRAFVSHAWAKQLLNNVHMGDSTTASVFFSSMVAGAAVYTVAEHLKSAGRSDRAEYLNKRLSPDSIAKAAFSRSGFSSFLPTMIDSVAKPLGVKPLFDQRTSSQPSDLWLGNPGTGLLDDATKAIRGIVSPTLEGRARTAEDARNIIRPLLWQNALPITILMNLMTSDMPAKAPRH